jgi:Phosphotransferase enzyme family
MEIEEPLDGGYDNRGEIVRVGDTLRRPARQSTLAVRALLLHLEREGFDGAPRYLDTDEKAREVLTFIEGEAPRPPYAAWSMTDEALDSFGELVRRFHDAASSFDATAVSGWHLDWADPVGGSSVCHNDLFPENVIFRDGRAVALIDFDMAAPGRPFWDLATATQEWMPLHAPETRRDHDVALDAVARFGRFARAYGVDSSDAGELVDVVFAERSQALANIRHEVEIGNPVWIEIWRDTGGDERAAIDDAWLAEHRTALVAAITRPGIA